MDYWEFDGVRVHRPKYFEYDLSVAPSQKKALKKMGMKSRAINRLSRKEAMDILDKRSPKQHIKVMKSLRDIKYKSLKKQIKEE